MDQDQNGAARKPAKLGVMGEAVVVHTELGVPVSFHPRTRNFTATVGQGRAAAELTSADFDAIIERIRERTLITPVDAYLIDVDRGYTDGEMVERVRLTEVQVIEFHRGRADPFVAVATDERRPSPYRYSLDRLYLPTEQDVEALKLIADELEGEFARHRNVIRALNARVNDRLGRVRHLAPSDVRYVQQSGHQVATPGLETPETDEED